MVRNRRAGEDAARDHRKAQSSARAVGKYLTEALGQSIIVDNKPGAAGNIGANFVAKAAADGYTLLMSNSTIAIPSLFANLPFDVSKDFDPISLVAIGPSVLAVHPSVPVNTVKELIALANVPTIDEAGLPGYDAATWYGFFAPAGTPKNVLATLGKEVVKIMSVPDIKERFASDGFEPVGNGPAEFSKFLKSELTQWAKAVTMAGIKPE